MLYIVNNVKLTNDLIYDVESSFFLNVDSIISNRLYERIIKQIDLVSYCDGDYIKTPFGGTSIYNLSSGCKALLLAVTFNNRWVNFLEAGPNVMDLAAEIGKTMDMHILCEKRFRSKNHRDDTIVFNGNKIKIKDIPYMEVHRHGY